MKTGIALADLRSKIAANMASKKDYIEDTAAMELKQDPAQFSLVSPHFAAPVRSLAQDQIAERVGIPLKYYHKMRTEAPELLVRNVNTWFAKKPEKRMVRTLGGQVRAFLSNRYNRIENEEIAAMALPVLERLPDLKVISCELTEKRMYIQAVTPRVEGEVKKGDVVQAGVIISNSEVGYGAVSVSPLIMRLACLNGMIAPDGRYRAHHVGRLVEDNDALWAEDTRQADDRAVLLKVRDMVANAVDAVAFSQRLAAMQGLTEAKITGDPSEAVGVLAAKVGATETERAGIMRALIEGADLSAWGLLNAVTAQAHQAEDYDRSVEFEAMGGKLLELDRKEWKTVLEAA